MSHLHQEGQSKNVTASSDGFGYYQNIMKTIEHMRCVVYFV